VLGAKPRGEPNGGEESALTAVGVGAGPREVVPLEDVERDFGRGEFTGPRGDLEGAGAQELIEAETDRR